MSTRCICEKLRNSNDLNPYDPPAEHKLADDRCQCPVDGTVWILTNPHFHLWEPVDSEEDRRMLGEMMPGDADVFLR